MPDALWTFNGVRLGRESSARLKDITLKIRPGATAILGSSGAGKTSLLNLLVEFERPDSGTLSRTISQNGHMLPLYWIPQDGGLWPHMSVREHLQAVAGQEAAERMQMLIESFEMGHRLHAYPQELSSGERARLAVMRGLLANASALVMDEPLAGVDLARADRFWRTIREEAARSGTSLIYATHSPQWVIGEADRVVCMREGAVLYEGPVQELYEDPPTRETGECLGKINWFTPAEAARWLGKSNELERGYRPERLEIIPESEGVAVVEESRAKGAVAETALIHSESGDRRSFVHISRASLLEGMRVAMRLLACLLVITLCACVRSDDPELDFSQVNARTMKPVGASIPVPRALAAGKDDLLAMIDKTGRIQVFDKEGKLLRTFQMPESEAGTPEGMCYMPDGTLAVADTHYQRIVFFNEDGSIARMMGSLGRGPSEFIYPVGLTLDSAGNLYVCEYGGNDRVQKFAPDGSFITAFGTFGTGPRDLQRPSGLAWKNGRIYVADAINNRVQVFTDSGEFIGTLGGENPPALHFPYDICAGPDETFYVIEYGAGRLTQLDLAGRVVGRFGRTGTGSGEFNTPWGLARDSLGRIFVADTLNARIVELTP